LTNNITKKDYWDNLWKKSKKKKLLDIYNKSAYNYVTIEMHKYFQNIFKDKNTTNKSILEIGCGDSVWLEYFHTHFNLKITGLDYSDIGCVNVKRLLDNANIEADIICADLFNPPNDMLGKFDYIVSFGVLEHFNDTSKVITAFHKYLKPDGVVITNIPNMSGILGIITKTTNPNIYKIHNPLSKIDLIKACHEADVDVAEAKYFLSNNFGVLNTETLKGSKFYLVKLINGVLSRLSLFLFWVEINYFKLPITKIFSPYIHIVTKNKAN